MLEVFLHHADVMDKLQGQRQQLVVGAGSKQTVVHHLMMTENMGGHIGPTPPTTQTHVPVAYTLA